MDDRPEMPYLAAGAVALIGATVHEQGWPKESFRAILGTVVLVIIASTAGGTRLAPLVRAFGLLVLLVSVIAAIRLNLKK